MKTIIPAQLNFYVVELIPGPPPELVYIPIIAWHVDATNDMDDLGADVVPICATGNKPVKDDVAIGLPTNRVVFPDGAIVEDDEALAYAVKFHSKRGGKTKASLD